MNVRSFVLLSNFQTNAWPVQLRHHPVKERQTRSIWQRQLLQGQPAIIDSDHLVPLAFECLLEQPPGHRVIVCDENLHGFASSAYASNSGNKSATSFSSIVRTSVRPDVFPSRPICSSCEAVAAAFVTASPES